MVGPKVTSRGRESTGTIITVNIIHPHTLNVVWVEPRPSPPPARLRRTRPEGLAVMSGAGVVREIQHFRAPKLIRGPEEKASVRKIFYLVWSREPRSLNTFLDEKPLRLDRRLSDWIQYRRTSVVKKIIIKFHFVFYLPPLRLVESHP